MALPYYQRYPRDFIDGTAMMDLELKGAYAVLLDIIYLQDGACPDNDRYISGLLGCSIRKWVSLRNQLISLGKIYIQDGKISNYRANKMLESSREYQSKQRENRLKQRDNSKIIHSKQRDNFDENEGECNKNNDLQKPSPHQTESESDIKKKYNKKEFDFSVVFKAIELTIKFDYFYSKFPRKKGKNQAAKTFARIIQKFDIRTIMKVLKADMVEWEKEKRELQHIPYPASWLNATDFDEEPQVNPTEQIAKPTPEVVRIALSKIKTPAEWQNWWGLTFEEAKEFITGKKLEVVAA